MNIVALTNVFSPYMLQEEMRYRLLRYLEEHPDASQRELARELGVSLGKVNYCLKALIEKGLVKAGNFRKQPNKRVYAYLLTPKGFEEKAAMTIQFLKRKMAEHRTLEQEIEELRREAAKAGGAQFGRLIEEKHS